MENCPSWLEVPAYPLPHLGQINVAQEGHVLKSERISVKFLASIAILLAWNVGKSFFNHFFFAHGYKSPACPTMYEFSSGTNSTINKSKRIHAICFISFITIVMDSLRDYVTFNYFEKLYLIWVVNRFNFAIFFHGTCDIYFCWLKEDSNCHYWM